MNTVAQAIETPTTPDYEAIKSKQQAAWATGDYSAVGATLQIVGERLIDALQVHASEQVLDVAGGNGNVSLAAARRFANVTCTDYVPELLAQAAKRAEVDGLRIKTQVADVEALPFENETFAVVTSTFGAMFAPNHEQTAAEMFRVTQADGRIGMANWTPDSFIGELFATLGGFVPPVPGLRSPALWGTQAHLEHLFPTAKQIQVVQRDYHICSPSAQQWVTTWRKVYGPINKAFAALDEARQTELAQALEALVQRHSQAQDDTMFVPSHYLEVVIYK